MYSEKNNTGIMKNTTSLIGFSMQWQKKYTNPANPVRNFCMQKWRVPPCVESNDATQQAACYTGTDPATDLLFRSVEREEYTKPKRLSYGGA